MKLAIIGAGAAGVFCAANLKSLEGVSIFESQSLPLRKLMLTGGGRCNFTNLNIDSAEPKNFYPRGAGSLRKPLRAFTAAKAVEFFEGAGVKTKVEDFGRVFPASGKAASIANALLKNTASAIRANSVAERLEPCGDGFQLYLRGADKPEFFDAVVVAVGGRIGRGLRASLLQMGHTLLPEIPSLYALRIDAAGSPNWQPGLAIPDAEISADFGGKKISATGAILTTHFGITGPAVLKFSSFAAPQLFEKNFKIGLKINLIYGDFYAKTGVFFQKMRQKEPKKRVKNACPFAIPLAFWQFLIAECGVNDALTYANLSKADEAKITLALAEFSCCAEGRAPNKSEFVTCGGVDCGEVDFATMQSKKAKNLFFLGECLNLDAITGGFNLHAAWTTAYVCANYLNKTFF